MKDKIIPPPQEVNKEIENAQLQAEVKAKKKDKKKLLKELMELKTCHWRRFLRETCLQGSGSRRISFTSFFLRF